MAVRYLKPGEDFTFEPAFGFTESAKGRHDARNHPADADDDEYGDGSYVDRMRRGGRAGKATGGRVKRQIGGPIAAPARGPVAPGPSPAASPLSRATVTLPVTDAARAAAGMVQAGKQLGARQAIGGLQQAMRRARPPMAPAAPAAAAAPAAQPPVQVPAMAKGGKFIQGAIKHEGRMERGAKRAGMSTHDYMEAHRHDPDPSLRSAANLGLRLTGGDLSPHKRKKG